MPAGAPGPRCPPAGEGRAGGGTAAAPRGQGRAGARCVLGGHRTAQRQRDEATRLPKKQRDGAAQPCHGDTAGGGDTRDPRVPPCRPRDMAGWGQRGSARRWGASPTQDRARWHLCVPHSAGGGTGGAGTRGDTRSSPAPPRRRGIPAWCRGLPERIPPQSPAGTPGTATAAGDTATVPMSPGVAEAAVMPPATPPTQGGTPSPSRPPREGTRGRGTPYLLGATRVVGLRWGVPGGAAGGVRAPHAPPLAATAPASPDKAATAPGSPCASPTRSAQPKGQSRSAWLPPPGHRRPPPGPPAGVAAAPGTAIKPSASGGPPKLAHALVEPLVRSARRGSPPLRRGPRGAHPAQGPQRLAKVTGKVARGGKVPVCPRGPRPGGCAPHVEATRPTRCPNPPGAPGAPPGLGSGPGARRLRWLPDVTPRCRRRVCGAGSPCFWWALRRVSPRRAIAVTPLCQQGHPRGWRPKPGEPRVPPSPQPCSRLW